MVKTALVVCGARPSAVKLAPVVHALLAAGVRAEFGLTGQHGPMLDCCLASLRLRPEFRLEAPDGPLPSRLARMVDALGQLLDRHPVDAVLVVGDTISGLAGAQAGFFADIPVGHVEAGLRTYGRDPWPEEKTRRAIDALAYWHFAPTRLAADNLRAERIDPARIWITGNTIVDSLKLLGVARQPSPRPTVLVTVHRRENWQAVPAIARQVAELAAAHPNARFIWPVHPNPIVKRPIVERCRGVRNIVLGEPAAYEVFLKWLAEAWLAISDSGGVQEEAATLGVPTLVLRRETERPEAVAAGVTRLVGTDFLAEAHALLSDPQQLAEMARPSSCFGDGQAGRRIADYLAYGATQLGAPPC